MFKSLVVVAALFQATSPFGCGEVTHQVGGTSPSGVWTVVDQPLTITLTEVSAVDASEVYLVGEERQFFRFDGAQIQELPVGPSGSIVQGLVATAPGTFTAVGNDGTRAEANLRFSGGTLASEAAGRPVLTDAAALPGGEVIAVGGATTGVAVRRTAAGWADMALPSSYPYFSHVATTASGTAYLLHVQGMLELSGDRSGDVAMPSTVFDHTALFAVTTDTVDQLFLGGVGGELAVRTANGWTTAQVGSQPWNAIWGPAANDVWAVGDAGSIAHFDGTGWSQLTSPTTKNLYALHGTADGHLIAVGQDGAILTYRP